MYIACVFLFVYDNIVHVLSRFMPVGCGWPSPVFGSAVLHFLPCRNVVLEKDGEDQLDRSCEK